MIQVNASAQHNLIPLPCVFHPHTKHPSSSHFLSISQMDSFELSERVAIGDIEFFRQKNPDTFEINFLFNFSCAENATFDFIQQVVDLGVTIFDSGFASILENKNHKLCLALLQKYGKTKNIQLINHTFCDNIALWRTLSSKKITHELMHLAIELMPNHTEPVFRGDKCYHKIHALNYGTIYEHLLKMLLGRINAVDGDAEECILRTITCLSQKKFPVLEYLIRLIERYGLSYLFVNRLNPRYKPYEPAMAEHVDLVQDKPDRIKVTSKKMMIYIELISHFKIPSSINSLIYNAMGENKPKVLPDEEQFDFLKTLDKQKKQCALGFFKKYLDYDRALLHEKLNALPEINENFQETIQKI